MVAIPAIAVTAAVPAIAVTTVAMPALRTVIATGTIHAAIAIVAAITGDIDADLCSGTAAVGVAEAVITHKIVIGGVDQIVTLLGDRAVLRLGKVLDAQAVAVLAVIGQHIDPGRSVDRCGNGIIGGCGRRRSRLHVAIVVAVMTGTARAIGAGIATDTIPAVTTSVHAIAVTTGIPAIAATVATVTAADTITLAAAVPAIAITAAVPAIAVAAAVPAIATMTATDTIALATAVPAAALAATDAIALATAVPAAALAATDTTVAITLAAAILALQLGQQLHDQLQQTLQAVLACADSTHTAIGLHHAVVATG